MLGAVIVLCLVCGALLYLIYLQWRQNEQLLNRLLVRHNYAPVGDVAADSGLRTSDTPSVVTFDDAMSECRRDNEIKFIVAEWYPDVTDTHYEEVRDEFPKEWELASKMWEQSNRQRVFGN